MYFISNIYIYPFIVYFNIFEYYIALHCIKLSNPSFSFKLPIKFKERKI